MIYDSLENLVKYNVVSQKVLDFLSNLDNGTEPGRYEIEDGVYANVDFYITKNHNDCLFESHNKYIDIQMMINGTERLDYIEKDVLTEKIPYNQEKDITFYNNPNMSVNSVQLTPYKFAFIYPYEAHRPQMDYRNGESTPVKKVVVKIKTH